MYHPFIYFPQVVDCKCKHILKFMKQIIICTQTIAHLRLLFRGHAMLQCFTLKAPCPRLRTCIIGTSIAFSYCLQVFHNMKLGEGQDIMAMALNKDNTYLIVSTADKQLIIFTDPAVSIQEFFIFSLC